MSLMKIGDLFELEKGLLQSSKNIEGEYDFITAAEEWKTNNEYSHECEALIFAAAASGSLGRTHYVNGKFITSDLCFILTPKDEVKYPIDLKFYHFVFNSLKEDIVKNTKTGTSKESINQGNLKNYEIPYFGIEQQHLWIDKLLNTKSIKETLENEILNQQNLLTKLKQSILQEAIEGKLTAKWREENQDIEPASILLEKIQVEKEQLIKEKKIKKSNPLAEISEEEIPFEIPDSWQWTYLDKVSINRDGNRIPVSQSERERKEKIYDYYGASGVIDKIDGFTHEGIFLLIGEDGANLVSRSTPIAFIASGKFWVNNHAHILQFTNDIFLEYIKYYINAIDLKPYITGGFQPKLSQANLNIIKVSFPPLEEQKEIINKIEKLFTICDELEEQINSSKQNTQTLMQAVLKEAFEK